MTYDEIGNPLTIGDINLSWINGRQLNSYITNNLNINYKYNKDGIRTEKNVNGNITKYYVEGNKIIYLQKGNEIIYFLYENDVSIGFKYAGNTYYYVKNIQNDVLGILNSEFEQIVKYEYDSYGKIKSIKDGLGNVITDTNHIGYINPFRYRSYYYDDETGLYYLNSRYYNPTWGRFINMDNMLIQGNNLLGNNIYIYCNNNDINFSDIKGNLSIAIIANAIKYISETASSISKKFDEYTRGLSDYTDELNSTLAANAGQIFVIKKSLGSLEAAKYFYDKVKHNGDWDYKIEDNWNKAIDVPYLGLEGKFLYNGKIITAEDFGNINYGYIGAVAGFHPIILYMGGGYAKNGLDIKIFLGPYYGDDINDHYSIKYGIDMFLK